MTDHDRTPIYFKNITPIHFEETTYGFEYGAANITRFFCDEKKGWVVIGLKTPRAQREMQIYVTKTGKVRVWGADGREWKPPQEAT